MSAQETNRYRVTIRPDRCGGCAHVHINGAAEEFRNETQAYLGALDSVATFTRWGARRWARRRVKQLARVAAQGVTETFEIEVRP